ncbi:hypothetical protein Ancab_023046 [Ancistrocladus abbreviatus]
MGRNIPMEEIPPDHYYHPPFSPNYPALKSSFHVAWMVVLIAIIGGLCGNRSKKTPSPGDDKATENGTTDEKASADAATATESSLQSPAQTSNNTTVDQEEIQKPLPPPPAAVALELGGGGGDKKRSPPPQIDRSSTLHTYMSKNASRRKLAGSISMRLPGAKSVRQKVEDVKDDAHKLLSKQEDSLWQKKILLGEKCRREGDDDDGAGGGAGGGSAASGTGSSQSAVVMSRSNSSIEDDAVSSCKGENCKDKVNERKEKDDD